MKRRIPAVLAFILILAGLYGCDSILDGKQLIIAPHREPVATPSDSIIEAGNFDELKEKILGFILDYEETGQILAYNYDGIIEEDVDLACSQLMNDNPVGAYAVSSITGSPTKIVSYYQIEINITYKVTKKQLDSIIPVSSTRYLKTELQDALSRYEPSMTVHSKNIVLSEAEALSYVSDIYYANPREIVMMPVTTVEFYPENGSNRIIVFTFGYTKYEASTLRTMEINLNNTVQKIAESVSGDDGEILLALAERLMEITDYDAETAAGGDYSNQNSAATAYGALVNAQAVGEGYAMAYKALCDELGIECYVVLGELDGKQQAWNIVELEDYYYHIDVSMCDVNGIASSFLLGDTAMEKNYIWDRTRYKPCNGPLAYTSDGEIINTDTSADTAGS